MPSAVEPALVPQRHSLAAPFTGPRALVEHGSGPGEGLLSRTVSKGKTGAGRWPNRGSNILAGGVKAKG